MQLEQRLHIQTPSPLQSLILTPNQKVWCKRDDLLHPTISGNKWRKLKPILIEAVNNNNRHIASFGGAYSNHLHALGYACYKLNIQFTAIVRAHPNSPTTPMLNDLRDWGASIDFVSREEYKLRSSISYTSALMARLNVDLLIPEGGSDAKYLCGVGSIIDEVTQQALNAFDLIVLPVASGGTMAGLIHSIAVNQLTTRVLGIAVLKGEGYLEQTVADLLSAQRDKMQLNTDNWQIVHEQAFHCGGYAKASPHLTEFRHAFFTQHRFALDRVYNAKSFFALNQLLARGQLAQYKRILILHTGGLQGDRLKTD